MKAIILFFLFHYLKCIWEICYIGISPNGVKFIMQREGFKSYIYNDTGEVNTIGYGFTNNCESILGVKINELKDISKESGEYILKYLIHHKYEILVNKYDIIYHFNQNQYDALVSFAYNYGGIDKLTNYGRRNIREISENIISEEFMTVKGIKNNGLKNRRYEEKKLFDTNIITYSSVQINITDYYYVESRDIIFFLETKNSGYKLDYKKEDIGVILYDFESKHTIRTLCKKNYFSSITLSGTIECHGYYPLKEGKYVIKLLNKGVFSNGDTVLPFNFTNEMYKINGTNIIDSRKVIYNPRFDFPKIYVNESYGGLYGNRYFFRGYVYLYNKQEVIKSSYYINVKLKYFEHYVYPIDENIYNIECKFIKLKEEIYVTNRGGNYLLKCKGFINTNIHLLYNNALLYLHYYYFEPNVTLQFYINSNYRKYPPRDILTVNSIKFNNISEDNIICFRLFGNSEKNISIKNIGSKSELLNFNIYFYGGIYGRRESLCYLFDNNGSFIIECYLPYFGSDIHFQDNKGTLYKNHTIFSFVNMWQFYIRQDNDEYDVILPFDLYFKETITPIYKEISFHDNKTAKDNNKNNSFNTYFNLFSCLMLIIIIIF